MLTERCDMNYNIGQYIEGLISKASLSQVEVAREINVSRQALNHVVSGNRKISLQLAMKLEAFFSLPDGELMKMQIMQDIQERKQLIRNHLCKQLMLKNAFWSYNVSSFDAIPEEEIIEKCFTLLDMDDINLMFELYSRKQIKHAWEERMAIQGEYMQMLNVMIAMYYFGIKNPEKYLKKMEEKHIKKMLKDASRING